MNTTTNATLALLVLAKVPPAGKVATRLCPPATQLLADCRRILLGDDVDGVLGPATDGGWWALGLRDPLAAAALRTVPTSRSDTGELTRKALHHNGPHLTELPEISDVDTVDDAGRVAGSAPGTRLAAVVGELW